MSSIEVEERRRIAERWTATVFAGVACLYGGNRSGCSTSGLFPSVGAGVQYVLKPVQGIVANLEFAAGKDVVRDRLVLAGTVIQSCAGEPSFDAGASPAKGRFGHSGEFTISAINRHSRSTALKHVGASHPLRSRANGRALEVPACPRCAPCERLVAPRIPVDRVERVLQQIGAGLALETVGAAGGVHSITASARSSTELGIEMPSALAVFRLTTNSKRVACSNGMSAGLAPLRMRST